MPQSSFRLIFLAALGLGVLSLMGPSQAGNPQSSPAQKTQLKDLDALLLKIEQLRGQGKYADAATLAAKAVTQTAALRGEEHADVAQALERAAELHELAGDFGDAIKLRRQVLTLQTKLDGEKHWRTVDAKLALAFADKAMGLSKADRERLVAGLGKGQEAIQLESQGKDAEAQRAALNALEVLKGIAGAESVEVARLWHLLGRSRAAQQDTKGATEANKQALAIRRKVLPERHPDVGRSLNNLSLNLTRANDPEGALKCQVEAVAIWKESLGQDHTLTVMGLTNLARVQSDLEDFAAASKSYKQVLSTQRKLLPADDQRIGDTLESLADAQSNGGEFDDACKSYEEALAIRRKDPNPDEEGIAFLLEGLGLTRWDMNQHAAAKKSYEEALAIRRKAPKPDLQRIAVVLSALGNIEKGLKDYLSAKKRYEELVAIHRKTKSPDDSELADGLRGLADAQNKLEEFEAARKNAEEALAIYRKSPQPKYKPTLFCLWALSDSQSGLQEFAAARKTSEDALELSLKQPRPDEKEIALNRVSLGLVLSRLHEYHEAKKHLESALLTYRKDVAKNRELLSSTLNNLAYVQNGLNEFAAAKKSSEESLAILRKAPKPDELAIAQSQLGLASTHLELLEYAQGKKLLEEALVVFRNNPARKTDSLAAALNDLSTIQSASQEFAAAKKNLEECLAILRKSAFKNSQFVSMSLINLGNAQEGLREYREARTSLEEALAMMRKVTPPDNKAIALALANLGRVQTALGDHTAARKSLDEVVALAPKVLSPTSPILVVALTNLGTLECTQHNLPAGARNLEAALAIYRKSLSPDHPNLAESLVRLALVQIDQKDFKTARKHLEEALGIYRKSLAPNDARFAHVYWSLGVTLASEQNVWDYLTAREHIEKALTIRRRLLPPDHPEVGLSLLLAGLLHYGEGNAEKAVSQLGEAADVFLGDQLRRTVAQSEKEQSNTTGLSQAAIDRLLTVAVTTKTGTVPAYDRILRLKGFVTSQQRWLRQLRDDSDPETVRLVARLREISRELVTLSATQRIETAAISSDLATKINSLTAERNETERKLSQRSETYRSFETQARIGLEGIRTTLPQGSALIDIVEYEHLSLPTLVKREATLERRLVAFVVRPDQKDITLVPLGPSRTVTQLVDRWRSSYGLGKLPPQGEPDPAEQLRKAIWEPLERHVRDVKVVLLSPDGPLHGLPLAALPGEKKGSYLLEEYQFTVVPVPQMLPELLRERKVSQPVPAALVVGNVDFGAPTEVNPPALRFGQLPGTEVETRLAVKLFQSAFPQGKVTTLLGKEATKKGFVEAAPKQSHLLVATHGFFLPDPQARKEVNPTGSRAVDSLFLHPEVTSGNPAVRSGLVFAGANRSAKDLGDAYLTALEVSELNLHNAELVVLSACETGLGQLQRTDGVLGLQRAFQVAGTRATVTSLWKVPDRATEALMVRFHENLWTGRDGKRLGRGEALREAQRWLITEWATKNPQAVRDLRGGNRAGFPADDELDWKPGDPVPPYLWAAFVLAGDWR